MRSDQWQVPKLHFIPVCHSKLQVSSPTKASA
jgi:hypothetical protein